MAISRSKGERDIILRVKTQAILHTIGSTSCTISIDKSSDIISRVKAQFDKKSKFLHLYTAARCACLHLASCNMCHERNLEYVYSDFRGNNKHVGFYSVLFAHQASFQDLINIRLT